MDAERPGCVLAVKLNVSDFDAGGFDADACEAVVRRVSTDGLARVDLVELSGGTYASGMACLGAPGDFEGASPGEGGLFAAYATRLKRASSDVPIALTGGIRCRRDADVALAAGAADVVGVARAACVDPNAARKWLDGAPHDDLRLPTFLPLPRSLKRSRRLLVPGLRYGWYQRQLQRLAVDLDPAPLSHWTFLLFILPRSLLFEPARVDATRGALVAGLVVAGLSWCLLSY